MSSKHGHTCEGNDMNSDHEVQWGHLQPCILFCHGPLKRWEHIIILTIQYILFAVNNWNDTLVSAMTSSELPLNLRKELTQLDQPISQTKIILNKYYHELLSNLYEPENTCTHVSACPCSTCRPWVNSPSSISSYHQSSPCFALLHDVMIHVKTSSCGGSECFSW
jgi:hypothetical protein